MKKRFIILGVSNYGFYMIKHLQQYNADIIAVDIDEERVNEVESMVQRPIIGDAANKKLLEQIEVTKADHIIVSLGDIERTLLCVLHLKELHAERLVVKAITADHAKILRLLEVEKIVFPEKDMAEMTVEKLLNPNLFDIMKLSRHYSIIKISAPKNFAEKTFKEVNLTGRYNISVILIKNDTTGEIIQPFADYQVRSDDKLFIIGRNEHIKDFQSDFSEN